MIGCANRAGGFAGLDDEVLLAVGDQGGATLENTHLHGQLRSAYLQTVRTLSSVIEVKDPDLRSHREAVATYVSAVAERLGLEPRQREELVFARGAARRGKDRHLRADPAEARTAHP
ncbi:MAG TPA: hypothetical protein VLP43_01015 [Solirubrobacteraceae bacterium]|nr:hypothetical protein [Solirubrobacteraceae bacterium]